jgi:hypothetical protein
MPQFMKSRAIELLDGGIESYLLALYGLSIPTLSRSKRQEAKYAPIIGLLGASVELVIKACLVQAKGIQAMYKGDAQSEVYKFGTDVLKEFKAGVSKNLPAFDFIWKDKNSNAEQKAALLSYINKFTILQAMRANGLHAGKGCSRDITVTTANDIYQFFLLLAQGKKLKAYLKNIPAPESTVRDREAIIEDLSRRIANSKTDNEKIGYLRNMYLIMPYVPDDKPEWVTLLDNLTIIPPTRNDVSYLVETLENAHSIYLLKNRGGKEGLPVRIAPNDPNALPIDIQNIKRKLTGIPAEFNQDVLSANTRFEQNRLDLPIDDFLLDLFALGVEKAGILQNSQYFTAQQVWPFVVSAFSTQGTPRPCMELIKCCDEHDKLISYLEKAEAIGNGYFKRRCSSVIKCVEALRDSTTPDLRKEKDKAFVDSYNYLGQEDSGRKIFTPVYFRKYPVSDKLAPIIASYMAEEVSAGIAIEQALKLKELSSNDRKAIRQLMQGCFDYSNRNGLVAVLRSDLMTGMHSEARKQMFALDLFHYLSLK